METLDIVSLTGMALSIFCYIGTIVTYASFHELRNIPGMCLINVSVALLIPTVSFVVTLCVVISGTPCVALAILQQLCLLAAFSWMSLQAVHMVRTFVLTNWQTPKGHPQNRKQWARVSLTHALMGWGFPTIYTAVLLFFHFCHDCLPGGAQFRFGKGVNSTSSECWPGQTYLANHLSIDPLLILLTFNIMALLNVMIAIIRQRIVTRKVAGRELRKEMAVNLLILTKLLISLGATWMPVLLYQFRPSLLLKQIHILLNSWLGVLIFTLFATSQRIRRLWREKLRGFCLTKSIPGDLYKLRESSGSGKINDVMA